MQKKVFVFETSNDICCIACIAGAFNPCPALKHIVYSCAETVRHCFDHRGWERGRQVSIMLLSTNNTD